ncbi:NUDIX domain-containing protein [Paenibacillus ginsengarvi]|uniref:NUDIX domain-containing protein n=1 Tax=Paenibacillus ginsengarvi TaxID=400777 RepID=A0A3B0CEF7_9BACL|nr:NUDIX domain-containing protein [Paenibacillus ginsengarvi]RKN84093.1 NUDIX domain-containing protein [Paenibacillus ginsengarvi]
MVQAQFYYKNSNAPKPNQPTSIGVVAVIERNGSILLEKRQDSEKWALIGGAIHTNEALLEGLSREVKEETGLTVTEASLLGTFSDPSRIISFPDGNVKRIITIAYDVLVEPFTDVVCSEESIELRFIAKDQLPHIDIAETHLPIVQAIMNNQRPVLE